MTYVAAIFCGMVCAVASGQSSVQEDSSQFVLASDQEFDARLEPEAILMTGDLFESGYQSTMPHTNWQFGAELLLYDIEYGNVNFEDAEGENELASGLRIFFGWESDAGYGIRAVSSGVAGEGFTENHHFLGGGFSTPRGFGFQGASPAATVSFKFETGIGTGNIDLFKHIQHERFDVLLGFGLSAGSLNLDRPETSNRNSLIAGGTSLFTEGRYLLRSSEVSELSLVGRGRIALLEGEWEARWKDQGINYSLDKSTDLTITEGALGFEWERKLRRSTLRLRALYEYQLWNSEVTSDLVLNGAALRAGLTW